MNELTNPTIVRLVGGPQDGSSVVCYLPIPNFIFVQRRWMGDRHATYSRRRDFKRFPIRYDLSTAGYFEHNPSK